MPYSAWAPTRTNLWKNPRAVSTGAAFGVITNGTGSFITNFPGSVQTARRWTNNGVLTVGRILTLPTGLDTPDLGDQAHVMLHLIIAGGSINGAYVAVRPNNLTATTGQVILENLGTLPAGEYWIDVSGITSSTPATGSGGILLAGSASVAGVTVDATEMLVGANDYGPYLDGDGADTDTLRRFWQSTVNNSFSVQEERSFTYPPTPKGSNPLRPEDLLVEFRDSGLVRRGSIPVSDLKLKFQPVYNGVGSWLLTLPAEHRAVPYLRTPGAGIIITNLVTGDILMSGSTSKPTKKATIADPKGMVSIAGLDDNRLAFDARAFQQPSNADVSTQNVSHDVRQGPGSTIMRAYVNANIGPGSPVGRRGTSLRNAIILGPDPVVGLTTTQRARQDNLGDLLNKIASEAGGVGWRFVQVGNKIEFQTYEPQDRSAFIRLDVVNGTLQETNIEVAPPELTRSIVAGQGELEERQFIQVTTTESLQAEADWGLIIEDFKDQRQTNVVEELEQAGLGDLNERGFTKVAVKAVPSNDQTMIFLTDFFLGDKVSVVIEGQEQPNSNITEAAIVIDETGMKTAVAIGDVKDFDSDSALRQTVADNTRRVSSLERNIELTTLPIGSITQGLLDPAWLGPGPARVTFLSGGGLSADKYEWLGEPKHWGNRIVNLTWTGTTWMIQGHAHTEGLGGKLDLYPLLNTGWQSYNLRNGISPERYAVPRVQRLSSGIVLLSGLIGYGPSSVGSVLFTLPPMYRPDFPMIFPANNGDNPRTLTVHSDGRVMVEGGNWIANTYVSLDGIAFPAAGVAAWTEVGAAGSGSAFMNGWTGYNTATWGKPAYWKDPYGIVWFRGLVGGGNSTSDNFQMFSLPSSHQSHSQSHTKASAGSAFGYISGLNGANQGVSWKNGTSSGVWVSLGGVTLVTTDGLNNNPWKTLPMVNGWVQYPGGFTQAAFLRRDDGLAMLKGLIGSGLFPGKIANLGSHMLPEAGVILAGVSAALYHRMDINGMLAGNEDDRGRISATAGGGSSWVSLDGQMWMVGD